MKFNVTSIRKDVKELETRDIVFSSPNSIGYTSTGEKFKSYVSSRTSALEHMRELKRKLRDDFLYCDNECWCFGWKVKVVKQEHSWLSLNPMVTCYTGRIMDLKEAIEEHNQNGNPLLNNYGQKGLFGYYRGRGEGQCFDGFLEVRIYQDRTINAVWEVNWDGNKKAFFCLTKETAPMLKWWKAKQPVTPYPDESVEDYLKRAETNEETAWRPVFSDEEIRAKAFKDTAKERLLERGIGVWGGDLSKNIIKGSYDRHNQAELSDKTKELIYDFFDYEGNQTLKNAFNQKHLVSQDGYRTRCVADGICTLAFLESYLITQVPSKKVKKVDVSEKDIDDIWDDFKDGLAENGLSLFRGKSMFAWQRQDRYIVGTYWENSEEESARYWHNACTEAAVFIFDTKKKTRKFFRVNKETDTKDVRIPSLNQQICNYIQISVKERWDREVRNTVPDGETEIVYLNKLTPTEMFAGTNVEWIINNKDQVGFSPLMYLANNSWDCRTTSIPISDFGKAEGTDMNNTYLIVLATTGDKLLEQLLKAKLFKLYFLGLYGICSAGSAGNMVFRQDTGNLRTYRRQRTVCLYKKGSNLKKMIGLDIAKLRTINNKIYVSEGFNPSYKGVTNLTILPEALGMPMENIARLDPTSWNKLINVEKDSTFMNDFEFEEAFQEVATSPSLQEYVAGFNGNIKKIINFYESFTIGDLNRLNDYWSMRQQLKALQERVTTGERFFDEKKYPQEVKKAKRFVPYVQGMINPNAWRDNVINTPAQFRGYINSTFAFTGVDADSIQYIEKEGTLVGAAIKMNAVQNMNYLHDEMARWLSLYRDETKTKAFVEAVKRVSDFEYEDPDTGLAMVAPRQCSDLNMEGRVLDHCVASYVDPVINGTENILFIRRDENIGAPYFTMDLVPEAGSKSRFIIRQIHCYKNGDPTPEGIKEAYEQSGLEVYSSPKDVLGFVSKWINWMKQKKKITVSNLVNHYGALCAKRD